MSTLLPDPARFRYPVGHPNQALLPAAPRN